MRIYEVKAIVKNDEFEITEYELLDNSKYFNELVYNHGTKHYEDSQWNHYHLNIDIDLEFRDSDRKKLTIALKEKIREDKLLNILDK